MISLDKSIKSYFQGSIYRIASTATDSAFTGVSIDRVGFRDGQFTVPWSATLTEAKTLKVDIEYQESSDGSSWDTAVALQTDLLLATGGSGGSTENGVIEQYLSLKSKKKYIRFNLTAKLSATASDVVTLGATFILSNSDTKPI